MSSLTCHKKKINTFPPLCSFRYLRVSDCLDPDSNSSLTTASWRCAKRAKIIWGHKYLGKEICGIFLQVSKRVRVSPSATFWFNTYWGVGVRGGAARRAELRHNLSPLTLLSEQTGQTSRKGRVGGTPRKRLPMGLWLNEFDTSVSSRFRNL